MNKNYAEAPLFRDPIYDSATDPVVIWNKTEKCWWMLYTQRRSARVNIGVSHIHGTAIGVASSQDGSRWLYRGTLPNLDFEIRKDSNFIPGEKEFQAVIQAAKLKIENDTIACDRDAGFELQLKA